MCDGLQRGIHPRREVRGAERHIVRMVDGVCMPVVVTMESDLDEGRGQLRRSFAMQLVMSMRVMTRTMPDQHMHSDDTRG